MGAFYIVVVASLVSIVVSESYNECRNAGVACADTSDCCIGLTCIKDQWSRLSCLPPYNKGSKSGKICRPKNCGTVYDQCGFGSDKKCCSTYTCDQRLHACFSDNRAAGKCEDQPCDNDYECCYGLGNGDFECVPPRETSDIPDYGDAA